MQLWQTFKRISTKMYQINIHINLLSIFPLYFNDANNKYRIIYDMKYRYFAVI